MPYLLKYRLQDKKKGCTGKGTEPGNFEIGAIGYEPLTSETEGYGR